jgi:hypothetical protein
MSKGPKTTTTSTNTGTQAGSTTNTFGQITPEDTPDIKSFRDFKYQADPSSPYRFAQAKEDLSDIHSNPYGAYTTPAIRDAAIRTGDMNLTQMQGQQSAQENVQLNNMQANQRAALADLTKPQTVQTGGTYSGTSSGSGTGTSQQSGGMGQFILGNAIEGAAAGATMGGG